MPALHTYLDLEEHVKPYLNIGANDKTKDKLLTMLIDDSAEMLNKAMGVTTLGKHTVTDERFDGGVLGIKTNDWPILSVTTIKEGENETVFNNTKPYVINKNRIELYNYVGGSTGYDQSKITYVAGYVTYLQNKEGDYAEQAVTFPSDLRQANLIILVGLYNKAQNRGVRSYSIQGKTVNFSTNEEYDEFMRIVKGYTGVSVYAI